MGRELPPDWKKRLDEETGEESDRAKVVTETLMKESDRGCAIFGAAILHDDLEELFRSFFRQDDWSRTKVVDPLFQTYAPLAMFSARIQLAYAMGLITTGLHRKFEIVRRLRNDFAHEAGPIDFQDSACQDRLRLLISEGRPREVDEEDDQKITVGDQLLTRRQFVDRTAFVISISELSSRICFLKEMIEEGRDVRSIVAALEEGGR